jgi:hypothetical protein
MKRICTILNEYTVCSASYSAFLVLGLLVFSDYGLSWDESNHLVYGKIVYDHILSGIPLPEGGDLVFYGPFFDFVSYLILKLFALHDIRTMYLVKHLLTFLFFSVSILFFYRLCRDYFGRWVPAYLACLFLVVHPRIFAEAFYNPKDIPFLAAFVIACTTLMWFMMYVVRRNGNFEAIN